ncbi:MAG: tetratricopeptide repeat protein [Syntrophaceae bacterium]|nr:tetratricopeptide repeat protein [Syntrophaceae bacterium]
MDSNAYNDRPQLVADIDHCLACGASDEARKLSEQWLTQFPGDVEIQLRLGRALVAMDRHEQALAILKGVEKAVLQLGSVYIDIGDIHSHRHEDYEALSCYIRYLDLFPESQRVQEVTAKTNSLLGNREHELSDEDSYQNIQAVSSEFHTLTLAELYIKQGHVDMARGILKSILAKDQGNVIASQKLNDLDAIFNYTESEICETDHQNSKIISELTVWLNNIHRLRNRIPA